MFVKPLNLIKYVMIFPRDHSRCKSLSFGKLGLNLNGNDFFSYILRVSHGFPHDLIALYHKDFEITVKSDNFNET